MNATVTYEVERAHAALRHAREAVERAAEAAEGELKNALRWRLAELRDTERHLATLATYARGAKGTGQE